MKKLFVLAVTVLAFHAPPGHAQQFLNDIHGNVTADRAVKILKRVVETFDAHARDMGGTGFSSGIRSKLRSLIVSHKTRKSFKTQVLWTPYLMLKARDISEDDPALGKVFVRYCRMMPTTCDTYKSCSEKIQHCIETIFPDKDPRYYEEVLDYIGSRSGVTWLEFQSRQ